jgi:hypothetical protein
MQDIIWLENEIVFVLTRDRTLYRSDTDGRSFENVMGMLEDSSVEEPPFENGVAAMYPSDADPGRVFFQGTSLPACPPALAGTKQRGWRHQAAARCTG